MANMDASKVRNVGILGHGGAGKTMLIEHILHKAGKTSRIGRIADGNTAGDYLDEEKERQQTICMKLMHVDWKGSRIHLVDHPGYVDFLGEVAASTPLVDGIIIVIDATTGVQVGTDNAFKYAEKYGTPRAFFINKIDRDNVDFDAVVESIRKFYGLQCVPLVIPVGLSASLTGVVNILSGENAAVADQIETLKAGMMDVVAESDDALLEQYLETGTLTSEQFTQGLQRGITSGKIVPILAGSVEKDIGIEELMDVVAHSFPSPLERRFVAKNPDGTEVEIVPDVNGPFVGQVFRSIVDPFVGQLTLFRVISGTLKSDSEFYNVTTQTKERTGKLFFLCGKEQTQTPEVIPGDLAAMAKLKNTHFGDTIAASGVKYELPKHPLPNSMVKLAIYPKSRSDEDKLGEALNRLAEEDPTFSHYRDKDTQEHVVRGMGDLQLEIFLDRMKRKYGVECETRTPKVAYRETVRGKAEVQGKHKKQTGGHGQYGDVHLRISPNERGGGYQFIDSIVGGVVPRQYIPAVDKGCIEALQRGVIAGFPVVDIIVELFFGSYHEVDSSEMAFKIAASIAIQKGVKEARPCLLEPIMEIAVTVPEDYMGDITGDLNSRRGRILGMESGGPGKQIIRANVPEAEILRYSTDLRSMTGGRGSYDLTFSHYDEVPEHVASGLIAAYEKARAAGE
ncbi:MAG TPA: elongation factor G [Candidatus Hydrogenedentes bacterium]|nr:elongation factor G [Candidatus Hydrogenedentota bacterium]HOV75870.1 elongation factor G [Candidatus Hydrogenedentota bacterium]HPC15093.1 elongation factor G [Candidatus Hydrogenedentota bacterium]HRT19046.1 elongation factor G [Candidatus Hydrogenedentota bacterium]HRT63975.1 elongation factor G [Candidatus Hydrogenedentota bacterium]